VRRAEALRTFGAIVEDPNTDERPDEPAARHASAHARPRVVPPLEPEPEPAPASAPAVDREPSDLEREAALLGRAVARLRRERDPEGALALSRQYRAELPHGRLAGEMQRLEVESLLQLGRRDEALVLLDAMSLAVDEGELRLARGELRSVAGRCGEALLDLDAVLRGGGDAYAERALYGRASCRARLHDDEGARADLARYLARFPAGRYAEAVRDALKTK
jgi:hypothetical protein